MQLEMQLEMQFDKFEQIRRSTLADGSSNARETSGDLKIRAHDADDVS